MSSLNHDFELNSDTARTGTDPKRPIRLHATSEPGGGEEPKEEEGPIEVDPEN